MKGQKAEKQVRLYPKTHEILRKLAFKRRVSMAAAIHDLAVGYPEGSIRATLVKND